MALRSIGQTAKAQPGSALREYSQSRLKGNVPVSQGEPGSINRQSVQAPYERSVPAGTEKVTRATPIIEGESVSQETKQSSPLLASASNVQNRVADGGPMMSSFGPATASRPTVGGRTATSTSGGPTPTAGIAQAYQPKPSPSILEGASTSVQAERPSQSRANPSILEYLLGTKTMASEGQGQPQDVKKAVIENKQSPTTLVQKIAGKVGTAADVLGKTLGNILPEKNISEKLQSYGGSRTVAATKPTVSSVLRSVASSASNALSNLRSKITGRR